MGEDHLKEAKNWLQLARERCDLYDIQSHFDYLREYAAKAGVSLKDLGTSEEEIQDMSKRSNFAAAKKGLVDIRKMAETSEVNNYIKYLRKYLEDAKRTLADINTTEEELEELRIKGIISEAKKNLGYTQTTAKSDSVDRYIQTLFRLLTSIGRTIADIGVTSEELRDLCTRGHLAAAKKWLDSARRQKSRSDIDSYVKYVREHLAIVGAAPTDIGSSEEELEQLSKPSTENNA